MSSLLTGRESRPWDRSSGRPPFAFVAWGAVGGRSLEIAASLGGEARCFYPLKSGRRPPVLIRYLLSGARTGSYLLRRRPRFVVVTNPPVVAGIVTYFFARLVGADVALDSHPGGFGAQGDNVSAKLQGLHRFLARRSRFCMVTDDHWKDLLESWGAVGVVVHEAPPRWPSSPPSRHSRLRVLCVSRFGGDEPVEAMVEAARLLPQQDFLLTGDIRACPEELRQNAPDNVRFVGFLDPDAYREIVQGSDVILTLTTEPTSVMRAAYEAVYAKRPLVLSDWPLSRQLFPHAVHVRNDPESLAAGLRNMDAKYGNYAGLTETAFAQQTQRWEAQRGNLLRLMSAEGGPYLAPEGLLSTS